MCVCGVCAAWNQCTRDKGGVVRFVNILTCMLKVSNCQKASSYMYSYMYSTEDFLIAWGTVFNVVVQDI